MIYHEGFISKVKQDYIPNFSNTNETKQGGCLLWVGEKCKAASYSSHEDHSDKKPNEATKEFRESQESSGRNVQGKINHLIVMLNKG